MVARALIGGHRRLRTANGALTKQEEIRVDRERVSWLGYSMAGDAVWQAMRHLADDERARGMRARGHREENVRERHREAILGVG